LENRKFVHLTKYESAEFYLLNDDDDDDNNNNNNNSTGLTGPPRELFPKLKQPEPEAEEVVRISVGCRPFGQRFFVD
jgi:hypothetical protein